MRTQSTAFRLAAGLASVALFSSPVLQARAQAPAPPTNEAAPTDTMTPVIDPPSRVGRLAQMTGTVSFHTADETQWQPATQNYPITSGNSLWTEPDSHAEVEVGPAHMVIDQSTEFDIDTLGDHEIIATEAQGRVFLNLPDVQAGDTYQVRTPRGVVTIGQSGRYEVAAGDTDSPTTVTVVEGLAQVTGDNVSLAVGPNQTGQITGTDHFEGTVAAASESPFLTAELQALPPPMPVQAPQGAPAGRPAAPAIVAQMTGGDALAQSGAWVPTPDYGNVWYPPVDTGWVPYRHGHWGYVAPWGWTWIDDASWGFAPFHYGRWVEIGPRWGWIPVTPGFAVGGYNYGGGYAGPVYSPALVSFIGLGVGVAVGAAIGASVGWIPLGPREAYHPWYNASPNYVRNVNVTNVTNVNNINNSTNVNNFVNRRSATVVPGTALSGSQSIASVARPVNAQALASARPISTVPVTPTANTVGVTPAVAKQFNLPPRANSAVAPGPALAGRPEGATTPVGLAPPGGLHAVTPSAEGAPGVGGHPGLGAAAAVGGAAVLGGAAALSRPSGIGAAPGPAIGARPGFTGAATSSTLPTLRPTAPVGATTPQGAASPGFARPPVGATTPQGAASPGFARPPVGATTPQAAASPGLARPPLGATTPGTTPGTPLSNTVRPNTTLPGGGQPNAPLSAGINRPPVGAVTPGAQTVRPPVSSATLGNVHPNATVPNAATSAPVQHYTAPVQQYKAPVPQYRPPPVVHNTPAPAVVRPPPVAQVHVAPPPPVVHAAPPPPPKKVCPPGKPAC